MTNNTTNRLQELDALRGIAALTVLVFHYSSRYNQIYSNEFPFPFSFEYGYMGVDLFFMISGFVILMTLSKTKKSSDFIFARFSRLYPTFWASVILTFIVTMIWHLPGRTVNFNDFLLNLTMLPRQFNAGFVDGAYWSLEVELYFYVIIYILFRITGIQKMGWALLLWLVVIGIHHTIFPMRDIENYFIFKHAHLFISGMLFYLIYKEGNNLFYFFLLICCLVVQFYTSYWTENLAYGIFYLIFLAFIYGYLGWIKQRFLLFIGAISYPLYLIHQNIGYIIIKYTLPVLKDYPILIFTIAFIVSLLLAWFVHLFIEKKATNYIRQWYWKRKKTSS